MPSAPTGEAAAVVSPRGHRRGPARPGWSNGADGRQPSQGGAKTAGVRKSVLQSGCRGPVTKGSPHGDGRVSQAHWDERESRCAATIPRTCSFPTASTTVTETMEPIRFGGSDRSELLAMGLSLSELGPVLSCVVEKDRPRCDVRSTKTEWLTVGLVVDSRTRGPDRSTRPV